MESFSAMLEMFWDIFPTFSFQEMAPFFPMLPTVSAEWTQDTRSSGGKYLMSTYYVLDPVLNTSYGLFNLILIRT